MSSPRRFLPSLSTAALGLLAVALVSPTPASTVDPWKAISASGSVESRPDGDTHEWSRVRRGDMLAALSEVRTGRRSRATLIRDTSIVMVDPRSRVLLPADDAADTEIRQESGSVIYEVQPRNRRDFRVVTPYLVAGVKGTVFMVTVNDRYATVTVDEGAVEVVSRFSGETLELHAGESIRLDAGREAALEHVSAAGPVDGRSANVRESTRRLARLNARRLSQARREMLEQPHGVDLFDEGAVEDSRQSELIEDGPDDLDDPQDELSEDLEHREKKRELEDPDDDLHDPDPGDGSADPHPGGEPLDEIEDPDDDLHEPDPGDELHKELESATEADDRDR